MEQYQAIPSYCSPPQPPEPLPGGCQIGCKKCDKVVFVSRSVSEFVCSGCGFAQKPQPSEPLQKANEVASLSSFAFSNQVFVVYCVIDCSSAFDMYISLFFYVYLYDQAYVQLSKHSRCFFILICLFFAISFNIFCLCVLIYVHTVFFFMFMSNN